MVSQTTVTTLKRNITLRKISNRGKNYLLCNVPCDWDLMQMDRVIVQR